jgi:serine/threonine protein phosphatase PrpC
MSFSIARLDGCASSPAGSALIQPRTVSVDFSDVAELIARYQKRTGMTFRECLIQRTSQFKAVCLTIGSERFRFEDVNSVATQALHVCVPRKELSDFMSLMTLPRLLLDGPALAREEEKKRDLKDALESFVKNIKYARYQQEIDEAKISKDAFNRMVGDVLSWTGILDPSTTPASETGMRTTVVCIPKGIEYDPRTDIIKGIEFTNYDVSGRTIGLATTIGLRDTMEDTHLFTEVTLLAGKETLPAELYAIFDGHSGAGCAHFVAENFVSVLQHYFSEYNKDGVSLANIRRAAKQTCRTLRDMFLRDKPEDMSGTTATVVLMLPRDVIIINVGDSRVIFHDTTTQKTIQLTEDAKPEIPRYRKKIEARGGFVEKLAGYTGMRVNGVLSIAKSFGVRYIPPLDASPKITHMSRECFELGFLVVACDGLYEYDSTAEPDLAFRLTSSVVGAIASRMLAEGHEPAKVGRNLIAYALTGPQRSEDNVSVMTVPGSNMMPMTFKEEFTA